MPQILDDAVRSIRKENPKLSESSAYAIATKQLQKSGQLKKGTQEVTEKGKRAKLKAKKHKESNRGWKNEGWRPLLEKLRDGRYEEERRQGSS